MPSQASPDKPHSTCVHKAINAAALWIIFCSFCTCAGWLLSAMRQLNARGYGIAFAIGVAALAWWWKQGSFRFRRPTWRRLRKRFCRLTPAIFLIFALLSFLAGILYAPANYDALAYRLPRVLHWVADGRWHWIHTGFQRLNVRGCGVEWLTAPVIAVLKTDRPLFLINLISFCLLPGLLFGAFRRIGINPRVAYSWMWLLPLGCCFLFQASEIGNDLPAATFVVAAFAYGLKARESRQIRDLWISVLAMALATGVKATTLPLGLPWLVVMAPCGRLFFGQLRQTHALTPNPQASCAKPRLPCLAGTLSIGLIAALISFLPTAYFNWRESRDWTGSIIEDQPFKTPEVWARMLGNLEMTAALNLGPPIAPFAKSWNERVAPKLVPAELQSRIQRNLQHVHRHALGIEEMQSETSGLGLQICALLLGSTVAAMGCARRQKPIRVCNLTWTQKLLIAATAIAYLAVIKTSFVLSIARLLAPFYPLFAIPFLLHRGQRNLVRTLGWRIAVIVAASLTALPLFIRPERPLIPMKQILSALHQKYGDRPAISRAESVYQVYSQRSEAFAPALALLPPNTRILGFVTYDDPETSLWKPYGSRRIVHVRPDDTPEGLRAEGVQYVLTGSLSFQRVFRTEAFEDWLRRIHGTVIQTIPLKLRAGDAPTTWHLIMLN